MPPGKAVGNLAVTGKYPGRYKTSPGCHVAMFGNRLLFFIPPDSSASAGFAGDLSSSGGHDNIEGCIIIINADRSVDAVGLMSY
jgi:hypothetical protein